MTTTSLRPGCAFCETCLFDGWGDDATEDEIDDWTSAVVVRFDLLARQATGDESISWLPATGEIYYDCRGETDENGDCLDPLVAWPADVDFAALLEQATGEIQNEI